MGLMENDGETNDIKKLKCNIKYIYIYIIQSYTTLYFLTFC